MNKTDITFWLSIVGSSFGVILALIKLYEFISGLRPRLKAQAALTTLEEEGNTVTLINKSNIPAHISYFDLAWVEKRTLLGWKVPFTWKVVTSDSPLDPPDGYYGVIPAHGVQHLNFIEQYHFDWGDELKQAIYLRLWLVGRTSPIWFWITGPGSRFS